MRDFIKLSDATSYDKRDLMMRISLIVSTDFIVKKLKLYEITIYGETGVE